MNSELEVWRHINMAASHLKEANSLNQCRLCREDMKIVLEAIEELAGIALFAKGLSNHPHQLRALRDLAATLDRLRLLNMLITIYKFKPARRLITRLLYIGRGDWRVG